MAPKKKPSHQRKQNPSKPKPGSTSKPGAKLQISAENERRLRRLLLNQHDAPSHTSSSGVGGGSGSDASAPAGGARRGSDVVMATDVGEGGRERGRKRLRKVYDELSVEGFTGDQIEQALSTLTANATFETALDWLCFNIPGNELPLKFSTDGTSTSFQGQDVSIKVLSAAREDWKPDERKIQVIKEEIDGFSIKNNKGKNKKEEISLDEGKSSQAAWILQYMEREEEEERNLIALIDEGNKPRDTGMIIEEYKVARLGALEAKQKKDKNSQGHFGKIIAKLRQELSSLGISDEDLSLYFEEEKIENTSKEESEIGITGEVQYIDEIEKIEKEEPESEKSEKENESEKIEKEPESKKSEKEKEEEEVIELGDMFFDEESYIETPEMLRQRENLEKLKNDGYANMLGSIDDIWKQGEKGKLPKIVLQKFCQRLGWEAPKYTKVSDKDSKFIYSVNILRKTIGRGKSRKSGGLTSFDLPDSEEASRSIEEAQNKVATFAIHQLFAGLSLCEILVEPFSSLISKWQNDEISSKILENQNNRRDEFVEMLLNKRELIKVESVSAKKIEEENNISPSDKLKVISSENTGLTSRQKAESIHLKKELTNKMNLPKYKKMLETRSALPIAKLKNQFLNLLKDNNVIVVCGETGCGKTTQIPQFILDDMIESNLGGSCSIICTQPRRIAAISVAERVSDERCESSPGSNDSLVGYQVRLDSARNENTKLLFCTTGILLRKLSTNKNFEGITHVVVDEVHERSLLGDFLLIVLKNIIEKQAINGSHKLKVILMSATVDASLFSKYFQNCPVITAEGRTHPVSVNFLEDIYEEINYSLSSDSLSAGSSLSSTHQKGQRGSVDNRKGNKNLVLSSWGDESILYEDYTNPNYEQGSYDSYSDKTRQNLKRVNEDIIDFDLLEDLVCYIDEHYPPGAILVFLPGVAEIELLVDKLTASYRFGGTASDWIIPLHSLLSSSDQKKAFLSPPQNTRKVIVATDIAETSITIDDVVYVVETGKHKENRYNPLKKMSSIVEEWISKANAKQRRGRAGRVKPGICFCLYTRYRFESLMRPFQVPEMLRMPLTELCLHIKSLSLGNIKSFLLKAIEPPKEESISSAVDLLYKVGAFEGDEKLSPLGFHLSKLPVDVLIGKMMLYGAIFGCLSPILSIAAFLSHKSPFIYPKDEKQNVERAKTMLLTESGLNGDLKYSDHILMILAYNKWSKILNENGQKSAQQFCKSSFLNSSVLYMIRDMRIQFGTLLSDIGLVDMPKDILYKDRKRKGNLDIWFSNPNSQFNINAHHSSLLKAVICAGLYPNISTTIQGIEKGILNSKKLSDVKPNFLFDGKREVHIHPSSINHNLKSFQYPFLAFLEKVETTKVFIRDTTIVSPYSILLFGGPMLIQHQLGNVVIDGWLKLNAAAQTAVLFKELRTTLDAVLKELIRKPDMSTLVNNEVVKSIVHLLLEEEKEKLAS